jgi:tetratricopeptide (TPR) repeat protein
LVKHDRLPIFLGLTWFILLSIPALAYSNKASGGYDYLSHRAFLPLIGVLIVLIALLPQTWSRLKSFWVLAAIVMIFYLSITIQYSQIFANAWNFCTAAIRTNPNSPSGYEIRALLKTEKGDTQGAFLDYSRALQLYPYDQFALINHGNMLAETGDTLNAFADFSTLIRLYPTYARPFLDRGKWRLSAGNLIGAKSDFNRAIVQDSSYSDAYNNLGTIYLMQSDTSTAETYYLKALTYNNLHTDALYNYGLIRLWRHDLNNACKSWKVAAMYGSKPAQDALANHCHN